MNHIPAVGMFALPATASLVGQAAPVAVDAPSWLLTGGNFAGILAMAWIFVGYLRSRDADTKADRDSAAKAEEAMALRYEGLLNRSEERYRSLAEKFVTETTAARAETRQIVDDHMSLTREAVGAIVEVKTALHALTERVDGIEGRHVADRAAASPPQPQRRQEGKS